MQRISLLLSAACLWIAVSAQAQTPTQTPTQPIYAQTGMGYSFLTQSLKASGIAIKSDIEQVTATIGYQIHPRVAVEGQLGLGIGNKQASVLTGSSAYSNKINNSFAVFIKHR